MIEIHRETVPEQYYLGYISGNTPIIVVNIIESLWPAVKEGFQQRISFYYEPREFFGDFDGNWGVAEAVATTHRVVDGFVSCFVPISPAVNHNTSATFDNLFNQLCQTKSPKRILERQQLMNVTHLGCKLSIDLDTCYMHITSSRQFRLWLKNHSNLDEVSRETCKTMLEVFYTIRERQNYDSDHNCRAELSYEQMCLHLPGYNCPCFSPLRPPMKEWETEGFRLSTHNIDTPQQQIALLAGIAYLWQSAHQDLYE